MKESLKLLSRRERKEVLGKNNSNLWLLTIVIMATFLSIAFSNASMSYLSEKMDDPFTNWVDIAYGGEMPEELADSIGSEQTRARFKIRDFQTDYGDVLTFFVNFDAGENLNIGRLRGRYIPNLNCDLMSAILVPDNIVNNQAMPMEDMPENSLGAIVTADALELLSYDPENAPAYIFKNEYSPGADTLGLKYFENKFTPLPMPILAVVKRLPGKLNMMTTSLFYENEVSNRQTFNLGRKDYGKQLIYFVPNEYVEEFKNFVPTCIPDSLKDTYKVYEINELMQQMKPLHEGTFLSIYPFGDMDSESLAPYIDIAANIERGFDLQKATRIWKLDAENIPLNYKDYLSINFERLDSIRAFERYMADVHHVKIDMEQINSKENFNSVSVMASILSWAMIIFSIVCIILFIVNMLQSYFQKVKRNMGTFKAFGISTNELIGVYVMMLFGIVLFAIVLALVLSWGIELLLPALDILKDGKYTYLSLWSAKTIVSIIVMIVATVLTVYLVMKRLLRSTPGDLIYDR